MLESTCCYRPLLMSFTLREDKSEGLSFSIEKDQLLEHYVSEQWRSVKILDEGGQVREFTLANAICSGSRVDILELV